MTNKKEEFKIDMQPTPKPWPSRFGTLGEKIFGEEDIFEDKELSSLSTFSSDEIPPTRSPIDGTYFTSKRKLRAQYKAHGAVEFGTAFENGYDPQKSRDRKFGDLLDRVSERLKERLNR